MAPPHFQGSVGGGTSCAQRTSWMLPKKPSKLGFLQNPHPLRDITGYHPNYFLLGFRATPSIPTLRGDSAVARRTQPCKKKGAEFRRRAPPLPHLTLEKRACKRTQVQQDAPPETAGQRKSHSFTPHSVPESKSCRRRSRHARHVSRACGAEVLQAPSADAPGCTTCMSCRLSGELPAGQVRFPARRNSMRHPVDQGRARAAGSSGQPLPFALACLWQAAACLRSQQPKRLPTRPESLDAQEHHLPQLPRRQPLQECTARGGRPCQTERKLFDAGNASLSYKGAADG